MLEAVLRAIKLYGAKALAIKAQLSQRHVLEISKKLSLPSDKALEKLFIAAQYLENKNANIQIMIDHINDAILTKKVSVRGLAKKLGVDASNLSKTLSRNRKNATLLDSAYELCLGS